MGGDFFMIGIIQTINSISQVFFMLFLTDRLNHKTLISVGLLSTTATFASLALVTNIWQVIPTQIILGLAWACLYVGALRYLTEINEERSTVTGLLTSILSLSMIAGPIMATVLYALWPAYLPLFLNAIIMSLLGLFFFRSTCIDPITCERKEDVIIQTEIC
jgi:MFS family permease